MGMIEHGKLRIHDEIEIYYVDALKETYRQTFLLTDIQDNRATEPFKIFATLKFIDKNIINWLNTFEAKGFEHNDVDKILKYYIDKHKKDLVPKYELTADKCKWGNETKPKETSHVVPNDRSLAVLIQRWEQEANFIFFQNRKNIVATHWSKVLKKSPLEHPLKLNTPNEQYVSKIGDIQVKSADALSSNIVIPNITEYYVDHLSGGKKQVKVELDFKRALEESGSIGNTQVDWVKSNDTKQVAIRTPTSQKFIANYQKFINNMIVMEVIVPGWNKREIGEIVEVKMESHDNLTQDVDKNLSGKWLISKLTDKINQGFFSQKLTLTRSKHM
jgi:hypothetical protein